MVKGGRFMVVDWFLGFEIREMKASLSLNL